jgi:ATP-dependent Clp protease protease subunit
MFIRDRYMNALEAKEYGLVDEVLGDTSDLVVVTREGQIKFLNEPVPANGNQ